MSNRSKGRKAELEAKKLLEQYGWKTCVTDQPKRWKKDQDLFGLFDIIAVRGYRKKFIQVKCNRQATIKPYAEWSKEHANQYDTVELWTRMDRKRGEDRWKIKVIP